MTYLKFKFYRRFVTAASNFLSRLSGPCPPGPLPPDHGLRLPRHWKVIGSLTKAPIRMTQSGGRGWTRNSESVAPTHWT